MKYFELNQLVLLDKRDSYVKHADKTYIPAFFPNSDNLESLISVHNFHLKFFVFVQDLDLVVHQLVQLEDDFGVHRDHLFVVVAAAMIVEIGVVAVVVGVVVVERRTRQTFYNFFFILNTL